MIGILPLIYQFTPTQILKLKTFDKFVKTYEPSGYFTILNLDEEFIENEGGYPLPRQRLAEIHIELLNKGALGVGWVISFPQPDRLGGDEIFAEALSYGGSILSMFAVPNGLYPEPSGTVLLGNNVGGIMSEGVVQNIDVLSVSANQGIASAPVEVDQLVRRIPLLYKTPNGFVASFGTEVMKVLAGSDTYIIKTNDLGIEEITVQGLPPKRTDSLGRGWISWVNTPEITMNDLNVENKFVFVGVTANGVMPQIATPIGLLEPHKIQTALAESILIENSPYIPDWSITAEILIYVLSISLILLVLNYFGITLGLITFLLIMSTTASGGFYLIQKGMLIDVTWTLIYQFFIGAVVFYMRFREQFKLRQEIKKQFEHYLDPRQVKQLQKNPNLLKLGGVKKYCTFLFTDVRGFTSLSETLEPEEVTYIMNKALTAQVKAVQKHGGMVDKFIGDALMAIFGAPIDLEQHEQKAYECAIDIKNNMIELNKELIDQGIEPIQIGIGINTGNAIVGNMGSETRFDYTAIGDAVNVGARLESGTKDAGVDLLIGQTTKNGIISKLKQLPSIKAKGKSNKLEVYTWV